MTDWLPTLLSAAAGGGEDVTANADVPSSSSSPTMDGVDQWRSLSTGGPSPRTEMLYNIQVPGVSDKVKYGAAIR